MFYNTRRKQKGKDIHISRPDSDSYFKPRKYSRSKWTSNLTFHLPPGRRFTVARQFVNFTRFPDSIPVDYS